MDILQREEKYPVAIKVSPILGVEVSGIVESVGKDVKGFKVGEAVFGLMSGGAYAEFAVLQEALTMHKPDALSFEEAAAIPETWFTAYQALFLVGEMKKGHDVLIHAGASGVGTAAIQLAKEAGAIGATMAINYRTQGWSKVILQKTDNKGVDLLIDVIGKDYWKKNMEALGVDGHMVFLDFMTGSNIEDFDISVLPRKRLRIEGFNLRARSLEYQRRLRDEAYQHAVLNHFAKHDGALRVIVDKVFSWEDISDAHRYLESNQSMGKIVVKVTSNQ
ncbi:uncharacterized protein ATC70_010110 [Mucor velutinosus]|uniref:Enoyl reductase (ER) domain-containing protein n=1 Tax=Mucor velutinosus TaxID=708070 RepID=A0AAN7DRB7_9FUNG|nr:hypothetical protein ATC70_010110 [Mucor velutinosus]